MFFFFNKKMILDNLFITEREKIVYKTFSAEILSSEYLLLLLDNEKKIRQCFGIV